MKCTDVSVCNVNMQVLKANTLWDWLQGDYGCKDSKIFAPQANKRTTILQHGFEGQAAEKNQLTEDSLGNLARAAPIEMSGKYSITTMRLLKMTGNHEAYRWEFVQRKHVSVESEYIMGATTGWLRLHGQRSFCATGK